MCTSLSYRDTAGNAYFGRTLELTTALPYEIAYLPAGVAFASAMAGHGPFEYTGRHAFLSITMPDRVPTADAPIGLADLKVLEGLNEKGLTFSLLSYPAAGGSRQAVEKTKAVLSASDLGSWALSQFATVDALKAALAEQPVLLQPLAILGGVESPFHYVVHDASGASAVIEFTRGEMKVYDNPVGVMTNGPAFDWHLTNLDNYTFLSNVDRSSATFGAYRAVQPDSGIATAGLPASNTSVGRFVRAAFYAEFTEKAATPDLAVQTLAHIMNNFDRPRGVTIDYPEAGGGHLEVAGLAADASTAYATEFTSWTSLADQSRGLFFVRDYKGLNYTRFDLASLREAKGPLVVPLQAVSGAAADGSAALLATRPA
ncbi:linear amide C-N hydrolase [Acuticoccus kandeliae]|uniref:linear amide C-N hydrolase n=1 Tax=Acuticoccus kandeliae TaxID=2073160 RepID=UPI000D3E63CA|nr:linear amide C-N hydrolase [Acuticoccus kandeliae]